MGVISVLTVLFAPHVLPPSVQGLSLSFQLLAFRDDVLGIKFRVEVLGFILQCIVFSGHGFYYMFLVFGSDFRKRGCLFWFYHRWLRIHVLVARRPGFFMKKTTYVAGQKMKKLFFRLGRRDEKGGLWGGGGAVSPCNAGIV